MILPHQVLTPRNTPGKGFMAKSFNRHLKCQALLSFEGVRLETGRTGNDLGTKKGPPLGERV